MALLRYLLNKPIVANLITVLILIFGIMTLFHITRSSYPNVEFNIIKISTVYPGASAEDVEVNVTKIIEDELDSVEDIDRVLSTSLENLSLIYVFIDPNAPNKESAKDEVIRAIDRASDLPVEVDGKPHIQEMRSTNFPAIEIALDGHIPEKQLRKIAKDLEENIEEIKGVRSVEKIAYRKREVKIQVKQDSLDQNYLSLNEIIQAISDHNVRASGGNLETFTDEKKIVTFSEFQKPLDVGKVIIRSNFSGQQIRLDQIARIEDTFEDYQVSSRTNGVDSINFIVRCHANGDIIDISNEIRALLKEYEKTLPEGVHLQIVSDFSHYTKSLLNIVQSNAAYGFILVLVVLFIFLTRYTAFWTATGVPISILATLLCFPLFNIQINIMTLLTMILVLGLLVDDAIVIAENISRHREKGVPPIEASLIGVQEMFNPVLTTVLTTMIAFVPMFFMKGITGKFIQEMPIVVILTLAFSLLESTFLLPVHIAHSPLVKPKKLLWFEKMKDFYEKTIRLAVAHRVWTISAFVLFLLATFIIGKYGLKQILFPYQNVDLFYAIVELPEGSSFEQTSAKVKEVEKIIAEIPDSEKVSFTTRIGHHDTNAYGASAGLHDNWALIAVYLRPASERQMTTEVIMTDLEKKLAPLTGYKKLHLEKFYDGPPVGKPITITVVSDNDQLRRETAQEILAELEKTKGVGTIEIDEKKGKHEIHLLPDHDQLAKVNTSVKVLAQTVRAAYEGVIATEITHEGEQVSFRVELNEEERKDMEVLKNLLIPNTFGKLISLKNIVKYSDPIRGFEAIHHYDGHRSITISGDLKKEIVDGVERQISTSTEINEHIRKKFFEKDKNTPGLDIIFGGEEKATQESMDSFANAFPYAILGIYCILILLFNSYTQPLMIMLAIPFGLAGVVITFYINNLLYPLGLTSTEQPLSFLCLIGCLGLVGIVVNDSLVMVSYLNDLRKEHGQLNLELIIEGSKTRFRPVLLTTITTVSGLVPTIYGIGGYEPFLIPMVLSIAGGLLFATFVTLILVPTLYSISWRKHGQ